MLVNFIEGSNAIRTFLPQLMVGWGQNYTDRLVRSKRHQSIFSTFGLMSPTLDYGCKQQVSAGCRRLWMRLVVKERMARGLSIQS